MGTVRVFRNRAGTLEPDTTVAFARDTAAYGGAAWLDLEGDGDLDVYIPTLGPPGGAREFLWINQGGGRFEERRLSTRHPLPSLSHQGGAARILWGDGKGGIAEEGHSPPTLDAGGDPSLPALGDFDNDGDLDL